MVGAGGSQIRTKLSPQLGLAKLELGLSFAIMSTFPEGFSGQNTLAADASIQGLVSDWFKKF